jgi:hypothetical protein
MKAQSSVRAILVDLGKAHARTEWARLGGLGAVWGLLMLAASGCGSRTSESVGGEPTGSQRVVSKTIAAMGWIASAGAARPPVHRIPCVETSLRELPAYPPRRWLMPRAVRMHRCESVVKLG